MEYVLVALQFIVSGDETVLTADLLLQQTSSEQAFLQISPISSLHLK